MIIISKNNYESNFITELRMKDQDILSTFLSNDNIIADIHYQDVGCASKPIAQILQISDLNGKPLNFIKKVPGKAHAYGINVGDIIWKDYWSGVFSFWLRSDKFNVEFLINGRSFQKETYLQAACCSRSGTIETIVLIPDEEKHIEWSSIDNIRQSGSLTKAVR